MCLFNLEAAKHIFSCKERSSISQRNVHHAQLLCGGLQEFHQTRKTKESCRNTVIFNRQIYIIFAFLLLLFLKYSCQEVYTFSKIPNRTFQFEKVDKCDTKIQMNLICLEFFLLNFLNTRYRRDWPRQPNLDGQINKNWTAEKKPDGQTEWPNLTGRPNIY